MGGGLNAGNGCKVSAITARVGQSSIGICEV